MNKFSKLLGYDPVEKKTNVRTEIIAGIVTFLAMAYILTVNPNSILYASVADPRWSSLFIATALGAIIGTLLMAFLAKMPLAQASGMGLNSLVGSVIGGGIGFYSYKFAFTIGQAFMMVLISGVLFLALSLIKIKGKTFRELIFDGMPVAVRSAISVGIGLFIAYIGFQNAGVIIHNQYTQVGFVDLTNWGEQVINVGKGVAIASKSALVALIGLFLIAILDKLAVKGSVILGIIGATVVGIVSGILVVVVVEVLDMKLHVDDPVGAVGVHMANGIWGTIAVGLLANPDAPAGLSGLFYTGDFKQLGLQLLGFVTVAAYAAIMMIITFKIIKKTVGLRATAEEEIMGLDITEHGLPSAYAGFAATAEDYSVYGEDITVVTGDTPVAEAVEVKAVPAVGDSDSKFTKVEIICKEARFEKLKRAMAQLGITGMTVTHVMGYGAQKGKPEYYRGVPLESNLLPKLQVEMVVSAIPVRKVIETAKKALYTGHIGDGKIFVYDVENVVKIRTGEEGFDALQGDE